MLLKKIVRHHHDQYRYLHCQILVTETYNINLFDITYCSRLVLHYEMLS